MSLIKMLTEYKLSFSQTTRTFGMLTHWVIDMDKCQLFANQKWIYVPLRVVWQI